MMPKPPPHIYDLSEIEEAFEEFQPQLFQEMSSLFGQRVPKLRPKHQARVRQHLRRYLDGIRPCMIALDALQGKLERPPAEYALAEQLMREQLRAARVMVPRKQDAFDVWLKLTKKLARMHPAAKKRPTYRKVRTVLHDFSVDLAPWKTGHAINALSSEWSMSADLRRTVAFARRLPGYVRRFISSRPRRFTDATITRVAHEYKTCAPFVEMRLRLLLALDAASKGLGRPWSDWQQTDLATLLDIAAAHPRLRAIGDLVHRNVRNALAHGEAEWNANARQVRFHDRRVSIVWSPEEFLTRARALTWGCRALCDFELVLGAVRAQVSVATIWNRAKAKQAAPARP